MMLYVLLFFLTTSPLKTGTPVDKSIVGTYYDTTCFRHCSHTRLKLKPNGKYLLEVTIPHRNNKWKKKGNWSFQNDTLYLDHPEQNKIYVKKGKEFWTINDKTNKAWEFQSLCKSNK